MAGVGHLYRHDGSGNVVQENAHRRFTWNHSDRMTSFHTQLDGEGMSAYYLYDSVGKRVKKVVHRKGGNVETAVYVDDLFEHHQWVQVGGDSGENNWYHVRDNENQIVLMRVGSSYPLDEGPSIQYHLTDHTGSKTLSVDREGGFINHEEYTPYGETSFGSFARKRYRFSGKERDEESGLYYYGARYYSPWLLRWRSPDPDSPASGVNVYIFAYNNPIKYRDPTGRQPENSETGPPQSTNLTALCGGRCLSDREIYSDFKKQEAHINAVHSKGTLKQRLNKAKDLTVQPAFNYIWTAGSNAGLFLNHEKERVHDLIYGTKKQIAAQIEAQKGDTAKNLLGQIESGGNRAKNQAVGETFQAGLLGTGRLGARAAIAYWGYETAETADAINQACIQGTAEDCNALAVPLIVGSLSIVDVPARHLIAPHKSQPSPRPKGYQSHHPEQQTSLSKALGEQYNPNDDYTILLHQGSEHKRMASPQARQRQDPAHHQKVGSPESLGQAYVMLQEAGVTAKDAVELLLQHSGYLFESSVRARKN